MCFPDSCPDIVSQRHRGDSEQDDSIGRSSDQRWRNRSDVADDSTRHRGRALLAARALSFTVVGLTLVAYLISLPGLVSYISTPCADTISSCEISAQQVAPLARIGLTPHTLAAAVATLSAMAILLVYGVGNLAPLAALKRPGGAARRDHAGADACSVHSDVERLAPWLRVTRRSL